MGLTELGRKLALESGGGVMAESRRLVELGRALLAIKPDWVHGEEDQAVLESIAGELEKAVAGLDGRLVLGLLGGTGVGKSTLISALAGQSISRSSAVRPTTSRPVVYRHESFPPLPVFEGQDVVHQAESLRGLAIVDFPDFDSLETAHHQLVFDNLNELDLVVWVTDFNKYADRRFYEVMAEVRRVIGVGAQAAVLNKVDQLLSGDDGPEALAYVLESFESQLGQYGHWGGPAPWPVSAAEALNDPGDRQAGGLGPLRDLLDALADAKLRRAVEIGNLQARNADFYARLEKAAAPDMWLDKLERLKLLKDDYRPAGVIEGDLALVSLARQAYVAPRLDRVRKKSSGLLGFFTEAWEFAAARFRGGDDLPPAAPVAAAPGFVGQLAGRNEDLALITGRFLDLNADQLARRAAALIQKSLDDHFYQAKDPKPGSGLLILWPLALAFILVWAESGGQYGGPAALTAAILRSAAPWLIFSLLGDAVLTSFTWFRVRRKLESALQRALDDAGKRLTDLAGDYFITHIDAEINRAGEALNLLADIKNLPQKK